MEENKIKIFDDPELLEGEVKPPEKAEKAKVLGSYIIITVSFFVLMVACVFSEIGYDLIKSEKNTDMTEVFWGDDYKNNLVKTYSEYIIRRYLGVEKIYDLERIKETESSTDEPLKKDEQSDIMIPVDAQTEPQEETQLKEPIETVAETKYPVISLDLSQKQLGQYYIVNETGYSPDIKNLEDFDDGFESLTISDKSLPAVLIIHTHGTESYLEDGKNFYTEKDGEISRTKDKSKNVVRIGKIIADTLNNAGIKTIHCEIMHDEESYQDSYMRASESIKSYLAKYPSIKYVFDVHRDAILKSDGSLVKAVTEIEGENVAQVMTVVGSNYKGANFPDWEKNLAVAIKLKKILDGDNASLSRPVYLRGAAYNQQYAPCSLLLEIGTSGNTLKEAEKAALIVAKAITELITDLSIKN